MKSWLVTVCVLAALVRGSVKALGLRVADRGGSGFRDEDKTFINMTEINRHVPEFSPTSYHMTAVENKLGDIGRVNVSDADEPGTGNWEAKYSVSDDPHGYFSIRTDSETNQGILSVVKSLDYATLKEHSLTLFVRNIDPLIGKSSSVSVSTATVIVTVVKQDTSRFEMITDPRNWLNITKDTGDRTAITSNVKNKICTVKIKVTAVTGHSTTAGVKITTAENCVFVPLLTPLSGFICKNQGASNSGLVLSTANLPPHAVQYSLDTPWVQSSDKWSVTQVNETHAVLQAGSDVQSGPYQVSVTVSDSGTLRSSAHVNLSLCTCDYFGSCKLATALESHMGVGIVAFIVVIVVITLIPFVILVVELLDALKQYHNKRKCREVEPEGQGDAVNIGEAGCVERDMNPVNPNRAGKLNNVLLAADNFDLVHSVTSPPGLPDGTDHPVPAPTSKSLEDIEDCIRKRVDEAEKDEDGPPYDTALIYNYEGNNSMEGSLSSIVSSCCSDEQEFDYLNDWVPQFKKLAQESWDITKGDEATSGH